MAIIRYNYIIFILLVLITSSCGRQTEQDHSLTSEEYIEIGMPDDTSGWTSKDYTVACKTLNDIKAVKPLSLPKKDSKKSGKYFNRIINTDNLSFLYDESLSLHERAYQIQVYVDIQGCLITAYTDLDNTEQYYNNELIELYIFGLTIAQNMLDLGFKINESIEEEDLKMQNRFHAIQNLYVSMVLFVLDNQKKSSLFEETDLEKLTDYISSSVSVNRDWMDTAAAAEIKQRLHEIIDNTSSQRIKNKYNKLIEVL